MTLFNLKYVQHPALCQLKHSKRVIVFGWISDLLQKGIFNSIDGLYNSSIISYQRQLTGSLKFIWALVAY